MATNDHQNNIPHIIGHDGVRITSFGFSGYTDCYIDIRVNLYDNHDFMSLFARLASLENEVLALRKKVVFMEANPQLEEKFESLKQAGDEYRLLEKLVLGPTGEEQHD